MKTETSTVLLSRTAADALGAFLDNVRAAHLLDLHFAGNPLEAIRALRSEVDVAPSSASRVEISLSAGTLFDVRELLSSRTIFVQTLRRAVVKWSEGSGRFDSLGSVESDPLANRIYFEIRKAGL